MKTTTSLESKTRLIQLEKGLIKYTLKSDNVTDYLTYNKVLLEILMINRLKPFRTNGRLCLKIRHNKKDINIYLYDLAYACYSNKIRRDSYIEDIGGFYLYKKSHNLSIDHADNNLQNNTILNLSLMDLSLNASKGSLVSKVKYPVILNSIYLNNKYRVEILFFVASNMVNQILSRFSLNGIQSTGAIIKLRFLCETAEDYVDCLKSVTNGTYEWSAPLKENGKWIENNNPCLSANIDYSLYWQRNISQMPDSHFQIYRKK